MNKTVRVARAILITLFVLAAFAAFSSRASVSLAPAHADAPTWVAAAAPFIGSGTDEDPYLLSSAEDLRTLSSLVNGGKYREGTRDELYATFSYKLTQDVDLSGGAFVPIGNESTVIAYARANAHLEENTGFSHIWSEYGSTVFLKVNGVYTAAEDLNEEDYPDVSTYEYYYLYAFERAFFGTFDGDGHVVTGLSVESADNAGLFGYAVNALIRNVTVTSSSIAATYAAGGIVGKALCSSVLSSSVLSSAISSSGSVGGIVGEILPGRTYLTESATGEDMDVTTAYYDCVGEPYDNVYASLFLSDLTLTATDDAGGVFGCGEEFTVRDVFSSVLSTATHNGSIAGTASDGTLSVCLLLSPAFGVTNEVMAEHVFYPSDVFSYPSAVGLTTEELLTTPADEIVGEGWTRASDDGETRFYPSPTSLYHSFTAYEVLLSGEHVRYLYAENSSPVFTLTFDALPTRAGYDFYEYDVSGDRYDADDDVALTNSVNVRPVWTLSDLTSGDFTVSRTTSKTYDSLPTDFVTVSYDASTLSHEFVWYVSSDGVAYAESETTSVLTLTHVAQTAYYKCVATVSAENGVLTEGAQTKSIVLAEGYYEIRPFALTITATLDVLTESIVYTGSALDLSSDYELSAPFFAGDSDENTVTILCTRGGETVSSVQGVGTYVFTPVCEQADYRITCVPVSYTVENAVLTYDAVGYDDVYDAGLHGIALENVTTVDDCAYAVTYSTDDVLYSSEPPVFSEAGTYPVYYRIEAANHETARGVSSVVVSPLPLTLSVVPGYEPLTKTYNGTTAFAPSLVTSAYYAVSPVAYAAEVTPSSATASSQRVGDVTVNVLFTSSSNFTLSPDVLTFDGTIGHATVTITPLRTIEATYTGERSFPSLITTDDYLVTSDTEAIPYVYLTAAYSTSKDVSPDNDVLYAVFSASGTSFRFSNGLSSTTVEFAFSLSPALLGIDTSYIAALDRAYDGTTNVAIEVSEGCLLGVFGDDSPALTFSGARISSANASETPYVVTLNDVTVDDGNYVLPDGIAEILSDGLLTMTISKADPVFTVSIASDSLYASATALPAISLTGGTPGHVSWQYVVVDGTIDWSLYRIDDDATQFRYDFAPDDEINYLTAQRYIVFPLLAVQAISISVVYDGETSYEALTPFDRTHLTVRKHNNDGSSQILPYGNGGYVLLYPSGGIAFSGTDEYVTVLYSADGESFYENIPVTVSKIVLPVPYVRGALSYNGKAQALTPANFRSALMNVEGHVATHAGSYEAVVTLKNSAVNDYVFASGGVTVRLTWQIDPIRRYEPYLEKSAFTYDGASVTPVLRNEFNPSDAFFAVSGDVSATNAGEYAIRIALTDPDCVWSDGSTDELLLSWRIDRKKVPLPEIYDLPFVYDGTAHLVCVPENDDYRIEGDTTYLSSGSYAIYVNLIDTQNLVWDDETTGTVTLRYEVEKIKVVKPVFDASYFYTGRAFFVPLSGNAYYRLDGDLRATNAGEYSFRAILTDKENHCWTDGTTDDETLVWYVLPSPVKLPMVGGTLGYSGYPQTGLIVYDSTTCVASGDVATEVGTYEARVSLRDKNNSYWVDGTTEDKIVRYEIVAKRVDIPAAPENVLYNGLPQVASIDEDPSYVVVGNRQTEVGSYTITVSLLDRKNTVWTDGTTGNKTYAWKICALTMVDAGTNEVLTSYALGTQLAEPYRKGYTFAGWYLTEDYSGEKVTALYEVTENTTLYAKWVETSSVDPIVDNPDEKTSPLSSKAVTGLAVAGSALVVAALILIFGLVSKRGGVRKGRDKNRNNSIM